MRKLLWKGTNVGMDFICDKGMNLTADMMCDKGTDLMCDKAHKGILVRIYDVTINGTNPPEDFMCGKGTHFPADLMQLSYTLLWIRCVTTFQMILRI